MKVGKKYLVCEELKLDTIYVLTIWHKYNRLNLGSYCNKRYELFKNPANLQWKFKTYFGY